jgi:hypothetical protein
MAAPKGAVPGQPEPDTAYRRKCRMTWAALIKCVYEVDPLKCPKCGGEMRIISFIEEDVVTEKILRHCGLWINQQNPGKLARLHAEDGHKANGARQHGNVAVSVRNFLHRINSLGIVGVTC